MTCYTIFSKRIISDNSNCYDDDETIKKGLIHVLEL